MPSTATCRRNLPVMLVLLSGAALLIRWLAERTVPGGPHIRLAGNPAAALKAPHKQACTPRDSRADAASSSRASKLEAYEWELAMRRRHLWQYETTLRMEDVWDLMAPLWQCDANCTLAQQPCVVLSMGSAGYTDFETAILQRGPHCQVHTFDHTLTPQLQAAVSSIPGITFHSTGITGSSVLEAMRRGELESSPYTADNFTTVLGAMAAAGTNWVDVLKMDIDGSKWPAFHELLASNSSIPVAQVFIELHPLELASHPTLYPGSMVQSVASFFEGRRRHGYRIFANEPNLHASSAVNYIEYSFIKADRWGQTIDRQSMHNIQQ